jgi:hypothetical protein
MSLVHSKTLAGFDDMKMARQCLRELRRGQLWRPEMKITVQSNKKGHEELPLKFTHARGALLQGMLLGSIAGAIAGAVISLVDQSHGFSPVFFVAAFAFMGLLMGGFAGAIVGPMNPNPSLGELERDGGVALLIESSDVKDTEWADRVFHKWGAKPALPAAQATATMLDPTRSTEGHARIGTHRPHPSHG